MANHKSALKHHRQSTARRDRNRQHRARLRTVVKRFRAAVTAGDADQVGMQLPGALSALDRAAKLGAIQANVADRTKSRLARAAQKLGS